jgi:hypothetical protein
MTIKNILPKGTNAYILLESWPVARDVKEFKEKFIRGHKNLTYCGIVNNIVYLT